MYSTPIVRCLCSVLASISYQKYFIVSNCNLTLRTLYKDLHVNCFWWFRFLLYICGDENLDAGSEVRGGRGAPKTRVESADEEASNPAVSVRKGKGNNRTVC